MERKKVSRAPGAIQWKNHGGTHRMASGKIIKPNEAFWATPSEIPKSFQDVIRPVNPIPETPEIETVDVGFHLRAVENGLFHVVDGRGKVVSQDPMSEDEAKAVLDKLKV